MEFGKFNEKIVKKLLKNKMKSTAYIIVIIAIITIGQLNLFSQLFNGSTKNVITDKPTTIDAQKQRVKLVENLKNVTKKIVNQTNKYYTKIKEEKNKLPLSTMVNTELTTIKPTNDIVNINTDVTPSESDQIEEDLMKKHNNVLPVQKTYNPPTQIHNIKRELKNINNYRSNYSNKKRRRPRGKIMFSYIPNQQKNIVKNNIQNINNNTDKRVNSIIQRYSKNTGINISQIMKDPQINKLLKSITGNSRGNRRQTYPDPVRVNDRLNNNLSSPIIYNKNPLVTIYEGEFLSGILTHKLQTDINESPVIIEVNKDYYDNSGEYIIIPRGTRIIGKSKAVNYQGASRLAVMFHRMILPNGVSIYLTTKSIATDIYGRSGVGGKVNRHFFLKYGTAFLMSIFDGVGALAQNRIKQMSPFSHYVDQTIGNLNSTTKEIINETRNIMPTITATEGKIIMIYMSQDIKISAYMKTSERQYYRN